MCGPENLRTNTFVKKENFKKNRNPGSAETGLFLTQGGNAKRAAQGCALVF